MSTQQERDRRLDYLVAKGDYFTLESSFNNPKDDHLLYDDESVDIRWKQLKPGKVKLILDFVDVGLQTLGVENPDENVRIAAQRLKKMYEDEELDYHVSEDTRQSLLRDFQVPESSISDLMPATDAPVYIKHPEGVKAVVISKDFIKSAVTRPVQALTYLVRAASYARDDHFKRLDGSQFRAVRGLGVAEIPNKSHCDSRAESLMSEVLNQHLDNDQMKFHHPPKIDKPLYKIRDWEQRAAHMSWVFYKDPPPPIARRSREPQPDDSPFGDIGWK